jgi:response regulator RpfG family c-di-GMP phosphodiesterase
MPELKPTLLYVDDESINLELFELAFDDIFTIYTKQSGVEGLELLSKQNDIKLVISDFKMPGMNGVEFVTKANKLYPNTIFIILSGFSQTVECTELITDGVIKAYIVKPLVKDIFLKVVSSYVPI